MRSDAIALRPGPPDAAGFLDDESLEVDLAFADDDDASAASLLASDDAEGPIDPIEDEELLPLPEQGADEAGDLLGPEGLEDEGPALDDEHDRLAAQVDDAEGPLLEDEGDLGLPEQEEPAVAHLEGDDEGVPADDASFDLVDLPPLGAESDDGALFDEALDDLELLPEPGIAPAPPRPAPSGVQDRSPPT